ncbi:MAG: MFS transporter, partial [Clostridia bacterium]
MKNISRSSVVMYSFAGFGQNMLYAMMITYLIDFYSLKLGAIAGIIMFVARVLDALKDPIVGNYIDAHKSRYGKLRHFYIILPIPLALLTVLLFLIPDIGLVGKAIYCLIIFFLWGCCYTLSDLAYLGSSSAMSENVGERNKLISVSRLFCTLGGALPTLIVPLILSGTIFNLSNTTAYIISALVFGIAGSALFALGFPSAKEVIVPECKKVSFKGSIKIIKQNKPLLLILIATLLGSVRTIVQAMGIIIAKVNFGSADYFTYMAIAFGASLAIGTLLVPVLLKKLSFKKLYIYSSIIGFILQIVFYFVGYSNFYVVLFM